jgi:hypothetical protein
MLILGRTQFPVSPRCFVTSGERLHGTQFYWDASMQAMAWALLEPVGMKAVLRRWLLEDPRYTAFIDLRTTGFKPPPYADKIAGYRPRTSRVRSARGALRPPSRSPGTFRNGAVNLLANLPFETLAGLGHETLLNKIEHCVPFLRRQLEIQTTGPSGIHHHQLAPIKAETGEARFPIMAWRASSQSCRVMSR